MSRLSYCCLLPIPSDAVIEFDSTSTEAVQCAPDGEIHAAFAQSLDELQVVQAPPAAGIGNGYAAPGAQFLDQLLVDALLQPLVVCGMDQELGAVWFQALDRIFLHAHVVSQLLAPPSFKQKKKSKKGKEMKVARSIGKRKKIKKNKKTRTLRYLHVGYRLPFIHGHEPAIGAPTPATQVDDELLSVAAERGQHGVESILAELAVWEEERRDDDLLIDTSANCRAG